MEGAGQLVVEVEEDVALPGVADCLMDRAFAGVVVHRFGVEHRVPQPWDALVVDAGFLRGVLDLFERLRGEAGLLGQVDLSVFGVGILEFELVEDLEQVGHAPASVAAVDVSDRGQRCDHSGVGRVSRRG